MEHSKTAWLIVAALAVVAFILWKRSQGAQVTNVGGASADTAASQLARLQGIAPFAAAVEAESASRAQVQMSQNAMNAQIATASINAGAQISAADRQASAQQSHDIFGTIGGVITAALPFLFGL